MTGEKSGSSSKSAAPPPPVSTRGFDLCEVLYKRRNGFGKNANTNWVPRCFTYHGGVLCYHEEDSFEDVDPSRPRGRVDLSREDTKASYMEVKKPGAPSKVRKESWSSNNVTSDSPQPLT